MTPSAAPHGASPLPPVDGERLPADAGFSSRASLDAFPRPTGAGAFYSDLTLGCSLLNPAQRKPYNAIQPNRTA